VGTALTLTLGALALAGPAAAVPAPSPVNSVVATIPLPTNSYPEFTNVDPVRGVVWTAGPYQISEISERTNTVVRTITLNSSEVSYGYPDAMTVDPATGNVLMGTTSESLLILNGETGKVTVVDGVGSSEQFFARGVAVDPATGNIYVTDTSLDTVSQAGFANSLITVVSERTGKVIDQIRDPNCADQVVIDPDTHTVYVANSNPDATFDKGSSVWVINEKTNKVVDSIYEPSGYPDSMAIDPASGELFIPNIYDGPLTVINTHTDTVTAEVHLGDNVEPDGVAADPANGMVYVDNYGGTQVWVVDERTNTVVDTITVPVTYGYLGVDPSRAMLYQGSDLQAGDSGATSTVEAIKVAPGS
jgi:DNA-binding beta-propeller fold protein YncE